MGKQATGTVGREGFPFRQVCFTKDNVFVVVESFSFKFQINFLEKAPVALSVLLCTGGKDAKGSWLRKTLRITGEVAQWMKDHKKPMTKS